ncbi:unnamed protein product [Dovyalis caffra]|uniref:Uncharacterized protein n=1 Tax=Dovyalis caffra TaxID=77055 RepID=A0AAV1SFG6_9ROSI|nr:unnamed protein product [Dovyalis caffra]
MEGLKDWPVFNGPLVFWDISRSEKMILYLGSSRCYSLIRSRPFSLTFTTFDDCLGKTKSIDSILP